MPDAWKKLILFRMDEVSRGGEKLLCPEEIIYSRLPISDPIYEKNGDEFATEFKEARYNCGLLAITNVLQNHMESGLRLSQVQDLLNFQRKMYTSFKERLITASKRDIELFLSGSLAQKLAALHFTYPTRESGHFGRKADADIDVLIVDKSNKVSEKFRPGHYFLMQPTKNVGYVRLYKGTPKKLKCISSKGFRKHLKTYVDYTELFVRKRGNRFPERGNSVTGPAITKVENLSGRDFFDHDFVPAIQCMYWPSQAKEWLSRKRSSGWPTKQLLDECGASKCYVVPAACKESIRLERRKEWRLSFTETELKLARSFSEKQRQSYIVAKMIIKAAVNQLRNEMPSLKHARLVTSYDVKTTMFWLCESRINWDDLIANVKVIINNLLDYVGNGFLPDYFLPGKNLIKGLNQDMVIICESMLKEMSYLPVHIFKTCFHQTYSSSFQYDTRFSSILRKVYTEICEFETTGNPTRKLILLSILQIMVEISGIAVHSDEELDFSINVMVNVLNELHGQFVTAFGATKIFDEDDLCRLSSEKEMFEKVSLAHEIFLNTLANPTVMWHLGIDAFAVLGAFFSENVPAASLAYKGVAEVIEFAELVRLNSENEYLVKTAEEAYGSVENLLKKADEFEDKSQELHDIYSQTAETGLFAYHSIVKGNNLTETKDFACHEEKVIVYSSRSFEEDLSGIFEEESIGCPSSRERLDLLLSKVEESEIHNPVG